MSKAFNGFAFLSSERVRMKQKFDDSACI